MNAKHEDALSKEDRLARYQRVTTKLEDAIKDAKQVLLVDNMEMSKLNEINVESCILILFTTFMDEFSNEASSSFFVTSMLKFVDAIKNGKFLQFLREYKIKVDTHGKS